MNSNTEEIKSRINVVDLIGEYVKLQKAGVNWKANCPFHGEKTPSFVVSEEKQIWHCFGCDRGGDIFGFLMEMEGLEFREALKSLAERAGVQLSNYASQSGDDKSKLFEIMELATKFYEKQLWDGEGKKKIMPYLRDRGIQEQSVKNFRLGYAPRGWDNIIKFLTGRGYNISDIAKTGLLVEKNNYNDNGNAQRSTLNAQRFYDRFRDRIMFPIFDAMGRAVGFSARVAPGGDESQAKYVNTPETALYHKSAILYGIDKTKSEIKKENCVLLVEGNMDVIASFQAGAKNVAAVSGTALTSEQLGIINRYAGNIKMFFDMDEAGQLAARRSAELAFQKDFNVSIITIQEGKDAADLVKDDSEKFLQSIKNAVPAMEHFFDKIFREYNRENVAEKKNIASEILSLIKNFSSEIEKMHWLKKLAQKIDTNEMVLVDALRKIESESGRNYPDKKNSVSVSSDISSNNRSEIIMDKMAGIMLSHPDVWKKATEENGKELGESARNNSTLGIVLEEGKITGFDFEVLLEKTTDDNLKNGLSEARFKNKYRFGEDREIREVAFEELWQTFREYFRELKTELKKEKMKKLSDEIEKSQREGNREAVKTLTEEFVKISQEVI